MTEKRSLVQRGNFFELMPGCKCWSFWRRFFARVVSVLAVFLVAMSNPPSIIEESSYSEDDVKAVYLYKFLLFIEWPEGTFAEADDTITIGIYDFAHLGDVLMPVEGKRIHGRRLVIKRYKKGETGAWWKKCQLLFIRSLPETRMKEVLKSLKGRPVLTVSEMPGFIEQGGMVNFFMKDGSVRFEINKSAATQVGIKFRSRLLRVADRIFMDNYTDDRTEGK